MSNKTSFPKDPDAVVDFKWDWSRWLKTDVIADATVTADQPGLQLNSVTHDDKTVTIWTAGGTKDRNYLLTCEIVTAGGRTENSTITIRVRGK